jgi:hypothetical protein
LRIHVRRAADDGAPWKMAMNPGPERSSAIPAHIMTARRLDMLA